MITCVTPFICRDVGLHACCTLTLFLYFLALQSLNILVKMLLYLFHWLLLCVATHINLLTFAQSSLLCIPISRIAFVTPTCMNITHQRVQLSATVSRSKKWTQRSNVAKKDKRALKTAWRKQHKTHFTCSHLQN